MNINEDIVTRALMKAGQEPLNSSDKEKNSTRYRAIKSFYLSTLLETLSKTNWTSCKTRKALTLNEEKENLTDYAYVYDLPEDCAKPEELQDNADYIVEGKYLYTDQEDAVLMYITNGYNSSRVTTTEDTTEEEVSAQSDDDTTEDTTEDTSSDTSTDTTDETEEDEEEETEDYPLYDELTLDPMLSQYIETMLAAKIALKITGDTQLYSVLYQEARMVEMDAEDTSHDHSKNRTKGSEWWTETLGLGD